MEDWALIRRLVADGVPQRQMARDLGIGNRSAERRWRVRWPVVTSFAPLEPLVKALLVKALLVEHPDLPATVLAERVGWTGSITWFRGERASAPAAAPPRRPGWPAAPVQTD